MKSFKVLALLALAATLSCGSPTNVTQATDGNTDGFIKVIKRNMQASDLLLMTYISPILRTARDTSHNNNGEFTKNFVSGMWDNNKNYNYVVCRPSALSSSTLFLGVEGVDWAKGWIPAFNNEHYRLFIAGSGSFTRGGQGGYENWAWKGSVLSDQDPHRNVVSFVKPGSGGVIKSGGN